MKQKAIFAGAVFVGMVAAGIASETPRFGEAIMVSRTGAVKARIFTGSVHHGQTEEVDLTEGKSVGESARIRSGKNCHSCLVLSPGALMCVAPETELTLRQMRRSADGLPKTEEDLIRRIHIELHRGRILIHAGAPTPSMDIRIGTPLGEVTFQGGTTVVAQTGDEEWAVINEKYGAEVNPVQGEAVTVPEGSSVRLTSSGTEPDESLFGSPVSQFEICSCYFDDLETYIHDPGAFDRVGLAAYIGAQSGVETLDAGTPVFDVSPATRTPARTERRFLAQSVPPETPRRWDADRAWLWYENLGVLKGVNYIPQNAVNSVDMWMEETFDPERIDEELGFAQDAGYTTLRVQLQFAVWQADPEGFLERVKTFLELAQGHMLQVVPVLFDDRNFAQAAPQVGPQPEPLPGEHNARWVPSPGADAVEDRAVWPELERYVKGVISEFKKEDRILYWDLYHRGGDNELWEKTLPLMDQVFNWAREIDPKQPLATAAWSRPESAMTARKLERSDIITFQSFESAEIIEAKLLLLRQYGRPIICSDWLMRQEGNTFENILPLFSAHRVGWFNRGLMNGKTQEWIQQEHRRSGEAPEIWQHDVLQQDGAPYSDKEIEMIREFRFMDRN